MLLFKFRQLLIAATILISFSSFGNFTGRECLSANFLASTSHKTGPFGVIGKKLELEKNGCIISVKRTTSKFFKKEWEVDVCRAPIHIKEVGDGVTVHKRPTFSCGIQSKSEFCLSYNELIKTIQDDGLVFAKGDKEIIESDHGRMNCSHLLLEGHLKDGYLFSIYKTGELDLMNLQVKIKNPIKIQKKSQEQNENTALEKDDKLEKEQTLDNNNTVDF